MSEWRDKIKNAKTFDEYVKLYEEMWDHTVDMSPVGLERTTEKRMIEELKELFGKGFHQLALTERENKILDFLTIREKWTEITIKKKSDKEFDIDVSGKKGLKYRFSLWMPFLIIEIVDWNDPRIWNLNDAYGTKGHIPAGGKEWKGIIYSSPDTVWEMTKVALEIIEKNEKNGKFIGDDLKVKGDEYGGKRSKRDNNRQG